MALTAGAHLGPYEIVAPLGAGGMGEVYRARDTRLDRTVAIKVLPDELASDPLRRQRFEREARAVSSLNHPHICILYDVGRQGEVDYLVMEYLEGETLDARLTRGSIPPEQVLRFGIQMADALDKAHRQGIVHRDLKPANVMLTRSGIKLLDFGLARTDVSLEAAVLTQGPATKQSLTAEGTILGTFQYMAPEQLEGLEADARTDLFALGVLLYEMATGRKAFEGKSRASLIAAILEREPEPMSRLQPLTPPALERAVRRCLAKSPDDRWQSARDLQHELEWIAEAGSQAGVPVAVSARRRSREKLAWGLAGSGAMLAVLAGIALWPRPAPEVSATRFLVLPPAGAVSMTWPRISPDGHTLAFNAIDSTGKSMIWVRPMSSLTASAVPGTQGAGRPFWSPDSRHLAFFLDRKLMKIALPGGPPQLICDVPGGADGAWGRGVILFDGGPTDSLRQVSASGGAPTPATVLDRAAGETGHSWPCFLPDGRHFLFMLTGADRAQVKVGEVGSKKSRNVTMASSRVEYSPPGYLVYVLDGTLMAQRFDPGRLKTLGEPVPIAQDVPSSSSLAHFAVSRNGTLAYLSNPFTDQARLVWVDRSGREIGTPVPGGAYRDLALSPDAGRIAFSQPDPNTGNEDIWIYDWKRGAKTKFSFDPSHEVWPSWSPDGKWIAYASNRGGAFRMVRKSVGASEPEDTLSAAGVANEGPTDWSRDGRWLIFQRLTQPGNWDVYALPLQGPRTPVPILTSPFSEHDASLSPDGRWLAYVSNENGRNEVFVRTFPGAGGKWQASTNGGGHPEWRADGRELFFHDPLSRSIYAVPLTPGASLELGAPAKLFETSLNLGGFPLRRYVVSPDGQRFLLCTPVQGGSAQPFTVVENWSAELRGR